MAKTADVAVIDYGMGNLHSVAKALQHAAPQAVVRVSDDASVIRNARRVVYPGVGAIRDCMAEVHRRGLAEAILEAAASKPLLGICVGMQGLMRRSSENDGIDCLAVFPYDVTCFSDTFAADNRLAAQQPALKVPHMGWNQVNQVMPHPLWQGIANNARFYFVHSYYVAAAKCDAAAGITNYGVDIAAAVARDNVFALQFHPEKSHRDGLQLLQNFMQWDGSW